MIGAFVDEIVGHEVLHRRKQDVACGGHSFPHSKGDRRTIATGGAGCQWTASRSLRALPSVSSLLSWWVLVRAKAVMPCTKSYMLSGGRPSSLSTVATLLADSALERPRLDLASVASGKSVSLRVK